MKCLATTHFRLTKWISNSKTVMKALPSSELSKKIISLDLLDLPSERALGILWDPNTDKFMVNSLSRSYPDTKRGMLSLVSSIFDPLGFLTPSVLEPKLLIQELWRCQISWDDAIPSDLLIRWNRWKLSLSALPNISINRWYGFNQTADPELHIFADASEKAYGAVAYVKVELTISFVLAKSRLTPIKGAFTIPKLELKAAVIASRLKDAIVPNLTVSEDRIFFWSDSKATLKYIKNEKRRFPAFVMQRVNEIRLNSSPSAWRFVPGNLNPGDHTT